MEAVIAKKKEYEQLAVEKDPRYKEMLDGVEIVVKFIIDHGLIVYGGTAIDFALRLHGDSIYNDNKIPDLDFYSPDNVKHSYELADILYAAGYKDARAIMGFYVKMMHVDIGDAHYLADITMVPKNIFDLLPTFKYRGMLCIHPTYQRIDMHSSLAFPYANSGQEVVFNRWKKDVERFNILNKYYPVELTPEMKKSAISCKDVTAPVSLLSNVLCGFAAYSFIYKHFADTIKALTPDAKYDTSRIVPATFKLASEFVYSAPEKQFEFADIDVHKRSERIGLKNVHEYENYMNMLTKRLEGDHPDDKDLRVVIHNTKNKLLSYNELFHNERIYRVCNSQYLLMCFLSKHILLTESAPRMSALMLQYYISLLDMITVLEKAVVSATDKEAAEQVKATSPLFLSTTTYGSENIVSFQEMILYNIKADLNGEEKMAGPINYYPAKNAINNYPHPPFDPDSFKFFHDDGREIID